MLNLVNIGKKTANTNLSVIVVGIIGNMEKRKAYIRS